MRSHITFIINGFIGKMIFLPPAICSGQQLPLQCRIGDGSAHDRTKLSHSGQFPYLKTYAKWVTATTNCWNRRLTECNQTCLDYRGAKEVKPTGLNWWRTCKQIVLPYSSEDLRAIIPPHINKQQFPKVPAFRYPRQHTPQGIGTRVPWTIQPGRADYPRLPFAEGLTGGDDVDNELQEPPQ